MAPSTLPQRFLQTLLLCLCTSYTSALTLDVTSATSIRSVSSQVAHGLMKYYTGNNTGDVPGNLPDPYYWWEAGAMFGEMVEYWYYTGDTTYNAEVKQALLHQVGENNDYMPANQTKSLGNDDQVFWAFAAMTAAEVGFEDPPEGSPSWLSLAQAVFNEQSERWDTASCGGGLRWQIYSFNVGYNYKNSVSNGGLFQLAARLGRYTGNQTYIDWANKVWDWYEDSALWDAKDYKILDGASTTNNCSDGSQEQWSYTYGVFLAGFSYMYNHTEDQAWLTRIDGMLNTTVSTFFPTNMGPNIMVETTCEPLGNCNNDQRSFKAHLSQWMAVTAQLVPKYHDRIFDYLAPSAKGAAGQCDGGSDAVTCGREWNSTTWDGTYGVGEQMCALGVIQANMMNVVSLKPPYTSVSGGTSKSDPNAGTGTSGTSSSNGQAITYSTITTGDKAGAGAITAAILLFLMGGTAWLLIA
ncbi:mannan endo-1,6-alpha-mannosidase [Aureobasidium pullulans]|uniref:Mannan endo-1,6-alpha-mannosidase n=1 Tax=Aureobasidium pullulans TaxID=5580 RepID=A0AB74JPL6_AURPU|nr:mannan endo-1,6-alpha-mannosidase [Aureobasidium pullulans]THX56152.1 mannan endo-1,6-alpha-mannosidase [Aureobasidium pullulans]